MDDRMVPGDICITPYLSRAEAKLIVDALNSVMSRHKRKSVRERAARVRDQLSCELREQADAYLVRIGMRANTTDDIEVPHA